MQGSSQAICESLLKLNNDEVMVKIISSSAGAINESDIALAEASNAIILVLMLELIAKQEEQS